MDHPLDLDAKPVAGAGSLLDHYAALAATATQTSLAVVAVVGRKGGKSRRVLALGASKPLPGLHTAFSGLLGRFDTFAETSDSRGNSWLPPNAERPWSFGYMACFPLLSPSEESIGFICVADTEQRDGLTLLQLQMLAQIADLATADRKREMRHAHLMHIHERARRVDRLLRLVSDAPSCAVGLSGVLEELSTQYGAAIGTISQLDNANNTLQELSLWTEEPSLQPFFSRRPPVPMTAEYSMTAASIRHNRPHAATYSDIPDASSRALIGYAIAAGLACQVSVPIWVEHQHRFGIWLAFTTRRADLETVMEDIASLADTIRPALFRKVAEERIRFVAHHDELTQLANRLMFHRELDGAMSRAGRGRSRFALLYLDLDGFKLVNDTRGHDVGDKLLAAFAARLRESVREGDIVARLGGDEFAIIQATGEQPAAAAALAQRLVDAAKQPFDIDGRHSTVGVSVGIAIHPDDGTTPDALRRSADAALYRAKSAGRNTYEVSSRTRQQAGSPLTERDVTDALAGGQFSLVYQPICDAVTMQVEGLEALLRWNHPTRGIISPLEFIPLAEHSGRIIALGEWVLEAACSEAASWQSDVRLSVNLSPEQFRNPGLPGQVASALKRTGFPPARLDLEVTEGVSLDATAHVFAIMQELKALGTHLVVDDFGTAYAGLAYLRRFPFDGLKIDKSFIQSMGTDAGALAIVQSVVALSSKLNLIVVAEGVETPADLKAAQEAGCALVQGFFLGRPVLPVEARVLAASRPITSKRLARQGMNT